MRRFGYRALSGWGLVNAIVRGPVATLTFFARRMLIRAVMRITRW